MHRLAGTQLYCQHFVLHRAVQRQAESSAARPDSPLGQGVLRLPLRSPALLSTSPQNRRHSLLTHHSSLQGLLKELEQVVEEGTAAELEAALARISGPPTSLPENVRSAAQSEPPYTSCQATLYGMKS